MWMRAIDFTGLYTLNSGYGLPWALTCKPRAGIHRWIVSKTLHFSQIHSRSVYWRCAPTQQIRSCQNGLSVGKRKRGNSCEVHFESGDGVMYVRGFIRKHIMQSRLHLQHPICIALDRKYLLKKRNYDYIETKISMRKYEFDSTI